MFEFDTEIKKATALEYQSRSFFYDLTKVCSGLWAAISQIKHNKYADPFLLTEKSVYIIGVNFLTEGKKINAIIVEKWENGAFNRLEGLYKVA